eukprot:jgi/Botrbrau1/3647/Bobra.0204s0037.1
MRTLQIVRSGQLLQHCYCCTRRSHIFNVHTKLHVVILVYLFVELRLQLCKCNWLSGNTQGGGNLKLTSKKHLWQNRAECDIFL